MYRRYFKRLLDILLALCGLPILTAVLLICAPLIYLADKGPVFYNAPRLGYHGQIFTMYKLRSMVVNAPDIRQSDGSTYNGDSDPRLTPIGRFLRKTSLDEAPQVINVLKGDMSIVGPRPDLPEHREQYVGDEAKKLNVRPGITGYNQAYFRNTVSWKERLRNDVDYVQRLSFGLDMKIIFRTAMTVLKHENVYIKETAEAKRNTHGA